MLKSSFIGRHSLEYFTLSDDVKSRVKSGGIALVKLTANLAQEAFQHHFRDCSNKAYKNLSLKIVLYL